MCYKINQSIGMLSNCLCLHLHLPCRHGMSSLSTILSLTYLTFIYFYTFSLEYHYAGKTTFLNDVHKSHKCTCTVSQFEAIRFRHGNSKFWSYQGMCLSVDVPIAIATNVDWRMYWNHYCNNHRTLIAIQFFLACLHIVASLLGHIN